MPDWTSLLYNLNSTVLGVFGREVTYLSQAGPQLAIRGVFQPARESEDQAPGIYAVLFISLADLPFRPERGDEVQVDGMMYKIFEIEADTSGAVVLKVRQA